MQVAGNIVSSICVPFSQNPCAFTSVSRLPKHETVGLWVYIYIYLNVHPASDKPVTHLQLDNLLPNDVNTFLTDDLSIFTFPFSFHSFSIYLKINPLFEFIKSFYEIMIRIGKNFDGSLLGCNQFVLFCAL